MPRWPARLPSTTILSVVLLAGACSSGGPTGSAPGSAARSSGGTGPSATAASPAGASTQPTPPSTGPSSAEPPPAALAAEGGDPVDGQLGSFTWGDGGSDSPWLPGSPITVGNGERLTVSIPGGVGVSGWSASRVPAGAPNGVGAVGLGSGVTPVAFTAREPGAWSVQVTVQFAGGLGSATYYWQVSVR